MVKYCEVGDVARKLGVSVCTSLNSILTDSAIEGFIEDASGELEDFAGVPGWGIHQEKYEYHPGVIAGSMASVILLHSHPVIDILKVEYWNGTEWKDNTEETNLGGGAAGNYTFVVNHDIGKITFHALSLYGENVYRVTYTWGDETPGIVKRATACLAALRALNSTSGRARTFISQNGVQTRYAGGWQYGMLAMTLTGELNMHLSRLREFMMVV